VRARPLVRPPLRSERCRHGRDRRVRMGWEHAGHARLLLGVAGSRRSGRPDFPARRDVRPLMITKTRPGLPRSTAGAIVFAGLLAAVSAAAPAPPTADLAGKLTRIQTTCFDLYPEKLIRRMSGRPGPVPDDVKADPRKEVAYLKTEEKVAKGLFYPSILEDILPAFAAVIRPGMRFLDLGSGDGRIVFMAALLGAKATGIEYDAELHRIALEARQRLGDLVDPERA